MCQLAHIFDFSDESGMSLYLTPHIREQNIGSLFTGQAYLELPPGRVSWTVHGDCSEACLRRKLGSQDQSVFITSAYLHMHYLGEQLGTSMKFHILEYPSLPALSAVSS